MIYNIQSLRALAAYFVVCFHCQVLLFGHLKYSMGSWGVDIFFVMSGFVMAYTTEGRIVPPIQFIIRRMLRIVPLYWFMTMAVFVAALSMPFLFRNVDDGLGHLLMSLAFIPFEKSNGLVQPILFLGWTLNYEFFFYCLFCLSLNIREEINRYIYVSLVMIGLVILGLLVNPENVLARFYTNSIILEFVVGMWICYFVRRINVTARALYTGVDAGSVRKSVAQWRPADVSRCNVIGRSSSHLNMSMISVLGLASFGLLLAAEFLWPTAPRFVALGLPAASLVTAAVLLEANGISSRTDFAVEQGNSSYALYLTHFLSYQVCEKIFFNFLDPQSLPLRMISFVGAVALAGVVAWIVHRQIEIPLTQSGRELFGGLKRRSHARP